MKKGKGERGKGNWIRENREGRMEKRGRENGKEGREKLERRKDKGKEGRGGEKMLKEEVTHEKGELRRE